MIAREPLAQLRARLASRPIVVAPGVYDPLSAVIAEQAGAEALFVSGAALAMSQLGSPDVGLLTATELADCVARICDRVAVPVFVDGDQGYGNAAHVQRTVRALARAGAAAVQIEDQCVVKPAAALRTRPLVPTAEMVGKLHAALDARPSEAFLISARTDALSTSGFDDALDRAAAYVEAGVDLLFVEGLNDRAQIATLVAHFGGRVPLVHNLLESGGTPYPDAAAAGAAGFALALFPTTALGLAAGALRSAYGELVAQGSSAAVVDRLVSLPELNDIVGLSALTTQIAHYGDRA